MQNNEQGGEESPRGSSQDIDNWRGEPPRDHPECPLWIFEQRAGDRRRTEGERLQEAHQSLHQKLVSTFGDKSSVALSEVLNEHFFNEEYASTRRRADEVGAGRTLFNQMIELTREEVESNLASVIAVPAGTNPPAAQAAQAQPPNQPGSAPSSPLPAASSSNPLVATSCTAFPAATTSAVVPRTTSITQVQPYQAIVEVNDEVRGRSKNKPFSYYVLECPLCPMNYDSVASLFAHVRQARDHNELTAQVFAHSDAVKLCGTKVVDASRDLAAAHNLARQAISNSVINKKAKHGPEKRRNRQKSGKQKQVVRFGDKNEAEEEEDEHELDEIRDGGHHWDDGLV